MKASIAIATEIRSRIASGELQAGFALPVEDELTTEFGCSKPIVREALRILENEGLVEVKLGVGGGPRVRHPSLSDAARGMQVYLQVGDVAVLDMWAARDRMIASAIERLAVRPGVDLAPLEAEADALDRSIGEPETYNRHLLDSGEVAVLLAGNATEHVLVGALRHIIEALVTEANQPIQHLADLERARHEERSIATAWRQVLRHLRARQALAARHAYEDLAAAQRATVTDRLADR